MQWDTGWGDIGSSYTPDYSSYGDYTSEGGASYPGYSYSPEISGGGGGSWLGNVLGNALGNVGGALKKPNTWNAISGLGQLAGAAFGGGNKKPTYNYSPYQQQAYGQLQNLATGPLQNLAGQFQNLATTGLYNQQSIDDMLRLAQSSNVASGLAPNATSGMFRNTLGKLMLGDVANQSKFQSQVLGQQAGVLGQQGGLFGQMGGLGGQGVVQQAANPWYVDVAQTLQNQNQNATQNAILAKLLGGGIGGNNSMSSTPWMSS